MEKTYDPHSIEKQIYQHWESKHYFSTDYKQANTTDKNQAYCIMLPPPNVTGQLHMGHGFQHTLMDALSRYHRMQGYSTLWQPGTDHAGIATQMVVERQLLQNNSSRHELGREKFVEKVWDWKHQSGGRITEQMRRLGDSVDWDRECFTMDEDISKAVRDVFIQLYKENLIYRGQRLVNWDPKLHTAISDLEVVNQEENGHLWHIKYPIVDSNEFLIVATTRPETMLGDTAVAVHPEDARYQKFIGKKVKLPLTDKEIPIIADDYVEQDFGSGCVKITPAHDFNDNEIGKRHDLPLINILTIDAKLNENAPEKYQGLDRYDARVQIIADLDEQGLLEKTEDHKLTVPRGDRSGEVLEPYLTYQWFVKTKPLAGPAIQAIEQNKIKFVPENWSKVYYQWMHNIEDWCISRQLWWGHRIPAWYDDNGNIYVGDDEQSVRTEYNIDNNINLTQDNDVLDTWFSSALWPMVTLGWPEKTPALETFYPNSVLVTGFDIIFFWVARMIMMGLKFGGDVPFKEVYITGLIRDHEGQKMSKSKGNVLDPIDLIDGIDIDGLVEKRITGLMQPQMAKKIEKATRAQFPDGIPAFGTDALRFTFCALAATGRDIRFDVGRLGGYRNFCNKLWNAARYVIMSTKEHKITQDNLEFSLADKWILSKLQNTITKIHDYFKSYRFDMIAQSLYEFTWNEYCDWYLELSKPILFDDTVNKNIKNGTRYTLLSVLEQLLKLLHPLMPFITEEIWQKIKMPLNLTGESIMLEAYPNSNKDLIDPDSEAEIEWLKAVIIGIRNIRGEMNIAPSKPLPILLHKGTELDQTRINANQQYLTKLAKIDSINWHMDGKIPPAATALVGEMEILVPMADLIDKNAELARLQKELDKTLSEAKRAQQKLGNDNFTARAPAHVVEKEKEKLHEMESIAAKIQEQITRIEKM